MTEMSPRHGYVQQQGEQQFEVANLGRSPDLLANPDYGPTVRRFLSASLRLSTRNMLLGMAPLPKTSE